MITSTKKIVVFFAIALLLFAVSCGGRADAVDTSQPASAAAPADTARGFDLLPKPDASQIPNLQAELLDERGKTTASPLGTFDFKNYTYPLPRGWQNPDSADMTLTNGRVAPVAVDTDLGMDPDELAERKSRRRIGMSYVTTKFFDVTGDGQDEAFVVLKVETTGSAIPQIVYVYTWKDDKPELIWPIRTGDRADGGLKDLRGENGELVIELYGQDRFVLGDTETSKITDDEEQLCCPTYFTRSRYKWNGKDFLMQGKRLTFPTADPSQPPVENMMEIIEKQKGGKK
ncbi:MAG TPA: hypothetical protein VK468_09795 [Pyrinomonadaceae bacterium]|nr:hypothetical protein [Pyrinomonadaceae bacterium]